MKVYRSAFRPRGITGSTNKQSMAARCSDVRKKGGEAPIRPITVHHVLSR